MASKDSDIDTPGDASDLPPEAAIDNVDRDLFRKYERLRQLRIEHRDLDDVITRLSLDLHVNEIQLKRLKKRKLMLKDQIERYESQMIPDLNA
ncbi:MAG: YdcH family protein [Rhodobacteraceae bacterium]|nr:YdcH family protein [Paracoccaceae bacterium]